MERKRVVTSLLICEGKILLLKRSQRVATMKGWWHGVSGYLEEDELPYDRALKEIREEVNLGPDEVELVRGGEIIESPDVAGKDVIWVVHPFLFRVKSPGKIRLDWEHDECVWVLPADLESYRTVPRLADALKKLL